MPSSSERGTWAGRSPTELRAALDAATTENGPIDPMVNAVSVLATPAGARGAPTS